MSSAAGLEHLPWFAVGIPLVVAAAAALSAALMILTLPWLRSAAVAVPDARSSHRQPTPQGGGLGVILSTIGTAWLAIGLLGGLSGAELWQFATVTAAVALLALVGFLDDIRGLSPLTRLLIQCLAVGIIAIALPADLRMISQLPLWIERLGILIAGLWFVNLVNFMDGIDWMTVAEVVPVTSGIAILGAMGIVSGLQTIVALSLLGAIIGFAPFNKPVARLFLGDVGSLSIGLVLGWLLLMLALHGHLIAALLLPLYYLADATLTLIRRIACRKPPWQPHRTHFYQRAIAGGFTVPAIVTRIFGLNVALVVLAITSIAMANTAISIAALAIGATLVGVVLRQFSGGLRKAS